MVFLLCFGCAGVLMAEDHVPGATRDIEFSPEPFGGFTNSTSPVGRPRSSLLNDIAGPGDMQLNPARNNVSPVRSRGVVMPSRRSRELQDARENWAFSTPEEMMQSYMLERISKSSDSDASGQEKESYSVVERFYERMSRERDRVNGVAEPELSIGDIVGQLQGDHRFLNAGAHHSVTPNPFSIRSESRQAPGGIRSDPGGYAPELLGIRNPMVTAEEGRVQQLQEQRIRDFRRMLDQPSPGNPGFGSVPENPVQPWSTVGPQAPLPTVDAGRPGVFGAPNLNTDPALPTGPLPPSSPVASGQESLDPINPALTTGRITPPVMPSFAPPRRAF